MISEQDGITQRAIAQMCDISFGTVSRYIAKENYKAMASTAKYHRYSIPIARKIISGIRKIDATKLTCKKFAFYNFKGGVGKTSICYQVASHLAIMGYNILIIDADPQAHMSISCGFTQDNNFTLYDIITRNIDFYKVKKSVFQGLDCIPSNLSLTRLEHELCAREDNFTVLSKSLDQIEKQYDFIFIDTNPTISFLNRNVILFSDVLNIVCETQPYSLNGLKFLFEDLQKFYTHSKILPKGINVIPNKYEDRTASSAEAMTALRFYYNQYIKTDYAIRKSEDINNSAKLGKPLAFFAKKNSIASEDILELIEYMLMKYTK